MHAGHRARLVNVPTPKPKCLLHQAVQRWFASNGPVLSQSDFAALCSTCQVKDSEAARMLLEQRGSFVELGTSLYQAQWLGEGHYWKLVFSFLQFV